MKTLKRFLKYLLLLISFYILVNLLINLGTNSKIAYKDFSNYEIMVESPKIEIQESKKANSNGNIKGVVINDTGILINKAYLKLDFYSDDGINLGTKTQEINYFYNNESNPFDIEYSYKNLGNIQISITY